MTFDWRSLSPEEREHHYNPRSAIGEAWIVQHLANYEKKSAAARERLKGRLDIRFGERRNETFDLFMPAGAPRGTLIFIHGGYWRAMDKRDITFALEPAVESGYAVVAPNYDLCPNVTLDVVVDEMLAFARFLLREGEKLGLDPTRLHLSGHSAGAHLCARLLHHDWAAEDLPTRPFLSALLVSGIYEPEIVRHISVNADVRLTAEMAAAHDCLAQPPRYDLPLLTTAGAKEPAGWIAQSEAYVGACRTAGIDATLRVIDDLDHFSLLDHPIIPPPPPKDI
jgi:arylformamidase